jgi:hypothetical protein
VTTTNFENNELGGGDEGIKGVRVKWGRGNMTADWEGGTDRKLVKPVGLEVEWRD